MHLGLTPPSCGPRGSAAPRSASDVYDPKWNFWEHAEDPLDDMREQYDIPPLDPADAALADADISRADYERAGEPLPDLPE